MDHAVSELVMMQERARTDVTRCQEDVERRQAGLDAACKALDYHRKRLEDTTRTIAALTGKDD